jgi:hypothetical protein
MSEEDRRALWRQYAQAHASTQETFDNSIRTLAAAGLAVAVSIITALEESDWTGVVAVSALLLSLGMNLVSYVTAQRDLRERQGYLKARDWKGAEETAWTTRTYRLNVAAGVSLLVGGLFLGIFVTTSV